MLTQKKLKLFKIFSRHPFATLTRKQIKQATREKSNNAVALLINDCKKENVLQETKIGKSGILSLNLNNDLTYHYIALANQQCIDKFTQRSIDLVREEVEQITKFYSMVIFGSYAIGEQKKTSDLDIAIFIETEEHKRHIEAALHSATVKSLIPLDAHVISKEEMITMLTNDDENLGKQIAEKHLAIHNHHIFYSLVKEGMKHGFRSQTLS